MGSLSRKRFGWVKAILLVAAVAAAVMLLLDNAAKMIYPVKYESIVRQYSQEYNIDPFLVLAIIKVESNFRPDAVSRKNAAGLMQITAKTGNWGAEKLKIKGYSYQSLFEPEINIRIGCWYLSTLYDEFGVTDLVVAAYNGGSGNVRQWLSDDSLSLSGKKLDRIPFKETQDYIKKVNNCYTIYKMLYEKLF